MTDLKRLKQMIDEENYPYFTDEYLQNRLNEIGVEYGRTLNGLARELCIVKAGIEEIKLGDVIIPSPKDYFLMLASGYRTNQTGVVVRADE